MVFAGAACAGALLTILVSARDRLRGRVRVIAFSVLAAALIGGGIGLTRPEARAPVTLFAILPFAAALVLAKLDLRGGRR
ncbi:MAG: hypothetical protein ACT4P5_02935 [Armatimonadota bacterium]